MERICLKSILFNGNCPATVTLTYSYLCIRFGSQAVASRADNKFNHQNK